MKKIKVLIVDDSALVRQTLLAVFQTDPLIEVVGTAGDPFDAARKIQSEVPDVMTLDVEMPKMDGLTFLKKIMSQHPFPVVVISSLTARATESGMKALEYGAVDIITKPQGDLKLFFNEYAEKICEIIKGAATANVRRKHFAEQTVQPKYSADVVIPELHTTSMIKTTELIVAVGASTGGTEALKDFLVALPHDAPGIVIVQHMPEMFTKSFADRLNTLCNITVKEAENGDTVFPGRALIAPGNFHMLLKRSGAKYYVEIKDAPLVNRHRPSVDVLFRSAARYAGKNAMGIIMTGMGDDGAKGLLEMKEQGAHTIAQDEKSCVVFGMPKEAIKLGAADKIMSLDQIAPYMLSFHKKYRE
ncbi:MAG: chemotaxis response regulator protein-glutamate methylesterase [Bacteroidota bacterium]